MIAIPPPPTDTDPIHWLGWSPRPSLMAHCECVCLIYVIHRFLLAARLPAESAGDGKEKRLS